VDHAADGEAALRDFGELRCVTLDLELPGAQAMDILKRWWAIGFLHLFVQSVIPVLGQDGSSLFAAGKPCGQEPDKELADSVLGGLRATLKAGLDNELGSERCRSEIGSYLAATSRSSFLSGSLQLTFSLV
jgi:hypothetical protein